MNHDTTQLHGLLVSFCLKRIASTEDFAKAEAAILDDLFVSLSKAMGDALEAFDEALLTEYAGQWKVKDRRSRSILTEFGDVSFTRRIYTDNCKERRTLLDEVLGLRQRKRLSPGAFEALAYFGGEIPYKRAAKTCFRHCRTKVSAMSTLETLREVGTLLEADADASRRSLFKEGLIPSAKSQASELCMEADGIWVASQDPHRQGIEIKAMCAYAGKKDNARIGCMHHGAVSSTARFFEEGIARMAAHFSLDKIDQVFCASDGGSWEKKAKEYLPLTDVCHSLDPWHLNRAIKVAWPDAKDNYVLFELLYKGDICALLEVLRLRCESGYGDKRKTQTLITYIENNYESICAKTPSMGTMESTNAHVYASRMKAFGGGWSQRGASDMARIRSYVFSGDDLLMPKREQVFSKKDIQRRNRVLLEICAKDAMGAGDVVQSEGKGYEPPQGHLLPLSSSETNTFLRFCP